MNFPNKNWARKVRAISFIFFLTFLLCLSEIMDFQSIRNWLANYSPMIEKFNRTPTEIGLLPATYFSILTLLIPICATWLAWGENIVLRLNFGKQRFGRGAVETFVWQYFLCTPFILLILFLAWTAPFEFSGESSSFGRKLFSLMLNTKLGLLVFGAFFAIVITQSITIVWFFFALPFINLYTLFKRK